jgi:hypothetical protein
MPSRRLLVDSLLALSLVFSVASCGGDGSSGATSMSGATTGSTMSSGRGGGGATSGGGSSQSGGGGVAAGGASAGGAGGSGGGGAAGPKKRFKGLTDRGGDGTNGGIGIAPATPAWDRSVVNSGVMNVHWDDLQPSLADNTAHRVASTSGGSTGPTYVDNYLSQYRAAIPAAHRAIKLRIFAGIDAPGWVKTLSGGAVTWSGQTQGVPRWWDGNASDFDFTAPSLAKGQAATSYLEAYAKLIHAVADTYLDPASPKYAPEILDVTISGTMTQYAEPCIRQASDGGLAALHSAGLTETADRQAIRDAIQIHAKYVTLVTSSFALNPLQGEGSFDNVAGTIEIMDLVRSILRERGVLANNSISCDDTPTLDPGMEPPQPSFSHGGQGSTYEMMYGEIRARSSVGTHDQGGFAAASPVGFQTSASGNARYPTTPAEIRNMIDRARYFGAEYVELATNWKNDPNVTGQESMIQDRDDALEAAGPP